MRHIDLRVEGAPNNGTQPVEVEWVGEDTYRILHSPGLVEGVAAGDTIRVRGIDFVVVARGGNVSIKVVSAPEDLSDAVVRGLQEGLEPLGGRLDGRIKSAAVWTVPVAAGFDAIEQVLSGLQGLQATAEWWYGNVYDENDEPLRWWDETAGRTNQGG